MLIDEIIHLLRTELVGTFRLNDAIYEYLLSIRRAPKWGNFTGDLQDALLLNIEDRIWSVGRTVSKEAFVAVIDNVKFSQKAATAPMALCLAFMVGIKESYDVTT